MSKASKQRPCPALGRTISAADCGGQRQSQIACSADCPHNPFGPPNYSQLLEIDERVLHKSLELLLAQAPDRTALQASLAAAERRGLHAGHAVLMWKLFFAKAADQTTFAGRWEKSGLAELKNDERVFWRAKMQLRIILLEVHRVPGGGRVEGVDLLSSHPEPMVLQDHSLAGRASRFSTVLAWVFPLPHYWRFSGTAIVIPEVAQLPAVEIVQEITRHLGGPVTEVEMRRWLAEHFPRFDDALQAVYRLRRRDMLAAIDAKWGKAVYELRAPFARCRQQLDALADVDGDELSGPEQDEGFVEARAWFDPLAEAKHPIVPGGRMVLGRVLLGQSLWRLETFGGEKLSRLRQQFETQLGGHVRFSGERVDDMGARMSQQEPAVDESLAPPRLLENPERFAINSSRGPTPPAGVSLRDIELELMRNAERVFLDQAVPALDHRTPREAARDPALRPKLVELMKQRVREHDERNLQRGEPPPTTGETHDINRLLSELGLTEIMFDPPPWRPPPAPAADADLDDGLDDALDAEPEFAEPPAWLGELKAAEDRPPAPALPDAPLDANEAVGRLRAVMGWFETAAAAREELAASGATVLEDAAEMTLEHLRDQDFSFAVPFLVQAWFALVPGGCRAPEITPDELERAFEANLRQLDACFTADTPQALQSFFMDGPQPALMRALLGVFFEAVESAPKKIRPAVGAPPVILALLKSIVEKLDEALRRK